MKIRMYSLTLTLAAGIMLCTAAVAQQTRDRSDPPRTQGAAERLAPIELRAQTSLRDFPTDTFFPTETFNERKIKSLERAGIRTVGHLIDSDPARLGQILKLQPREVQAAQRKMRGSLHIGVGPVDGLWEPPR